MTEERMDLERFRELVGAYGGNPSRWPEVERKAALEFLMSSPDARKLREEETELDRLLDAHAPVEPSPALREQILATAPTRPGSRAGRRTGGEGRTGQGRLVASALAASLLLGFVTGVALQPEADNSDGGDLLQLARLGDSYQGF